MRGLIIDDARRRHAQKRGGLLEITRLRTDVADALPGGGATTPSAETLERVGGALDALASVDHALAELVDLRFFCGLSIAEVATLRDVSERTVQRDWQKARIYLHRALRDSAAPGDASP
jgi:DNA-directed RNA polymerase specialized sigma24 family protein